MYIEDNVMEDPILQTTALYQTKVTMITTLLSAVKLPSKKLSEGISAHAV